MIVQLDFIENLKVFHQIVKEFNGLNETEIKNVSATGNGTKCRSKFKIRSLKNANTWKKILFEERN